MLREVPVGPTPEAGETSPRGRNLSHAGQNLIRVVASGQGSENLANDIKSCAGSWCQGFTGRGHANYSANKLRLLFAFSLAPDSSPCNIFEGCRVWLGVQTVSTGCKLCTPSVQGRNHRPIKRGLGLILNARRCSITLDTSWARTNWRSE